MGENKDKDEEDKKKLEALATLSAFGKTPRLVDDDGRKSPQQAQLESLRDLNAFFTKGSGATLSPRKTLCPDEILSELKDSGKREREEARGSGGTRESGGTRGSGGREDKEREEQEREERERKSQKDQPHHLHPPAKEKKGGKKRRKLGDETSFDKIAEEIRKEKEKETFQKKRKQTDLDRVAEEIRKEKEKAKKKSEKEEKKVPFF